MAHSLNNATKDQFLKRVASFSTHGSSRGFVDIDLELPEDQLNDAIDKHKVLAERMNKISKSIALLREDLSVRKGVQTKEYIRKVKAAHSWNNMSGELKKKINLLEQMGKKLHECKEEITEAKKILRLYGVRSPRKDSTYNKLFSEYFIDCCRISLPREVFEDIKLYASKRASLECGEQSND